MTRLREAFFRAGWLIPVFLPLSHVMGRSVFTIGAAIYTVWGAAVFFARPGLPRPRWACALYGLLLLAFAAGVPFAEAPGKALRAWSEFLWWSSVFPFTLWVMEEQDGAWARLLRASLAAATAMLALSFGHYLWVSRTPGVALSMVLQEDTLPMLALLALGALACMKAPAGRRIVCGAGILSASLAFILLAQGRAALLGLWAGLVLFALLAVRWTWKRAAAAVGAFLVAAAILWFSGVATHGLTAGASDPLSVTLERLTSGRANLWRQALENPPDRPLVGIGMGNLKRGREVLRVVTLEGAVATVRHLHNFLLDCWYETGWLGLSALLAFLGAAFFVPLRGFARLPPGQARPVAAFFAAGGAVVASALFSFSYTSKYFAMYLPLCLAAWVATCAAARAKVPPP